MKAKGKKTPKYVVGGIIQGALGLGQVGFGIAQRMQANRELRELNKNRPNLGVPAAAMELADEPVAQELIQQQADERRRRTSQAIGAAGKGGTRALLGALQPTLDSERMAQRKDNAAIQQSRKNALGQLAQYQQRITELENQRWSNQVAGARGELGASQENIFGGFGQIGRGVNYLLKKMPDDEETETTSTEMGNNPDEAAMYGEEYGAMYGKEGMKLKGEFSHSKNPLHIVNDKGEKVGEATGGEVVLNPKQQKEVAKESPKFRRLLSIFNKKAKNG